jgi:hypothetical protein
MVDKIHCSIALITAQVLKCTSYSLAPCSMVSAKSLQQLVLNSYNDLSYGIIYVQYWNFIFGFYI